MSSISKKVTIDKKLTLLDLNENVTNFNMKFSLNSENMKDIFYMVITTQDDLDEGKDPMIVELTQDLKKLFDNSNGKKYTGNLETLNNRDIMKEINIKKWHL